MAATYWVEVSRGWVVSGVAGSLAMSATISVYAQKKGGLWDHLMGNVRGKAVKGCPSVSEGKTTASCSAAVLLMGTLY
jgi:hypothetical protein